MCVLLNHHSHNYTNNMYEQTIQRLKEERDAAVKQTQQLQNELVRLHEPFLDILALVNKGYCLTCF